MIYSELRRKLKELAQTFSEYVKTDLTESEYLSLAKLLIKARNQEIRQITLEEEGNGSENPELLIHPPPNQYQGQWVLIPRNNSWKEIHQYLQELFYQDDDTPHG